MNYSEIDCDEMVAEEVKTRWVRGKKKREWGKKPGAKRNELFDLWTYNIALFSHLLMEGLNPTAIHRKMQTMFAGERYPEDTPRQPQQNAKTPFATGNIFGKAAKLN